MKSAVELTILNFSTVTSRGYSERFSRIQCKIQLSRDNLGEKKSLESSFFGLLESLKSKISPKHHGATSEINWLPRKGDISVKAFRCFQT